MWTRWLPWRLVISRLARSHGFLDPISVLSRLHRFAQPSEVTEPIELLRAGVVFHARGLVNSRAIQHNLDWIWPHWVEQQFSPHSESFIPRAFSITHVNLTHRNWTAVGQPECDWMPIVDPRGMLTPLFDGWSLDAWLVPREGEPLLPSRANSAKQQLRLSNNLEVWTETTHTCGRLQSVADVVWEDDQPCCRLRLTAESAVGPGWLAVALRPVNPEGVSFIHAIETDASGEQIRVDGEGLVRFDQPAEQILMSHYRRGDVLQDLLRLQEPSAAHRTPVPSRIGPGDEESETKAVCDVGLATAAALFPVSEDGTARLTVSIPLSVPVRTEPTTAMQQFDRHAGPTEWSDALAGACQLRIPDAWMQFLFDAAVRNLILHSPGDVFPGPYTYKRFWFRDAAFMLNALLAMGLLPRAKRAIDRFPAHQTRFGYFRSQEGEWDSNGEALWIMDRYRRISGEALPDGWVQSMLRGARWIKRKRTSDQSDVPHAGLLPAGFSAEHLGPNDYYYWDDYWSVAGLRAAAETFRASGVAAKVVSECEHEAASLLGAVERSLHQSPVAGQACLPASPYRRMDAGAIGSVVVGYPLQLCPPHDPRLLGTVQFLLDNCLVHGGFFQDMIHSGVNAYLTLHLAQVLLRAGDPRYWSLIQSVADLASPTGQWPEAIHPRTGGGCMGDGQHIWAAAEWILMLRNCFVLEESDRLVLGAGLPPEWLAGGETLRLGPTPTEFGSLTVEVTATEKEADVSWTARWRGQIPRIEVRLAGYEPAAVDGSEQTVRVARRSADHSAERPAIMTNPSEMRS